MSTNSSTTSAPSTPCSSLTTTAQVLAFLRKQEMEKGNHHKIKLGTTRKANPRNGPRQFFECSSGANPKSCKWRIIYELRDGLWVFYSKDESHTHDKVPAPSLSPPLMSKSKTPKKSQKKPPSSVSVGIVTPSHRIKFSKDATDSTTKPFSAKKAPTGNARCIRCNELIEKGTAKIVFKTWLNSANITRGYHPLCFRSHPPNGVVFPGFKITWNDKERNAVIESKVQEIFDKAPTQRAESLHTSGEAIVNPVEATERLMGSTKKKRKCFEIIDLTNL
jgi:hypothetical protein